MGEEIAIMTVMVGIPAVLGWVFRSYLSHKQFMRVVQLKADLNARLLDRIGSDPQAIEFFRGDVQKELLEIRTPEKLPSAYNRMLTSVQLAAVLLSAGVAFLWFRNYAYGDDQLGFLFMGTVGVALGIGALLAAGAAFLVSKMWENSNRNGDAGARA